MWGQSALRLKRFTNTELKFLCIAVSVIPFSMYCIVTLRWYNEILSKKTFSGKIFGVNKHLCKLYSLECFIIHDIAVKGFMLACKF